MYKKYPVFIFLLIFYVAASAQDTVINNGFNVFHYPNGKVSSEGYMHDGKPDGFWKTYYENGVIKSEGGRKNFLLDSSWRFYNDSSKLVLEINYREGKKNGLRSTFLKDETIVESFIDDVKQGWTKKFYSDGVLKFKVFFIDGREEGTAREYSRDTTVITLIEYKKGYIISSDNINRYRSGLKHGDWKWFYPDDNIKEEGTYNYGKKDGYFKQYDKQGNLVSIKKYSNDVEVLDAPELASYEIRTDYYKNGKVKIVASYKDNIPEGVRRDYDPQGNIKQAYVFKTGIIIGQGIIDAAGLKQGPWKEFYDDGELYGEGVYKDGKKQGEWKFYFKDGRIEQIGRYNTAGKPEGVWKWYYESGNLKREESLTDGLENGEMKELTDSGNIIIKGNFINGEEDGEWVYEVNDDKETGSYMNGKKEGEWKGYTNGMLYFQGNYVEGLPSGMHIYYWDNGRLNKKGNMPRGKRMATGLFMITMV
jgi:uncharacterized protein